MGALGVSDVYYHKYVPYQLPIIKPQYPDIVRSENTALKSIKDLTTKFQVREPRHGKFHWTSLSSPRADSEDDGVVLIVGLFNLLAIIVYTAQKFLTGELINEDNRLINWQVQKVLDELVLRVHSSDTTANLLSRALKTGRRSRLLDHEHRKSFGSKIIEKLSQDDPNVVNNWVTSIRRNLIREISKSKAVVTAPRIEKQMYYPLIDLYRRVTETKKVGRALSTSMLQEVGGMVRTISNLGLRGTQQLLSTISKLGALRKNKQMSSESILTILSMMTNNPAPPTQVVRMRRSARDPNSRKKMRKTGIVEEATVSHGNWADGWFSLITMVAPIGLDMTVVYSKARDHPKCLTAYMCQSNRIWKSKGPVHATITPFLSVLTSWALEEKSHKSLGDSLIAIRAGWLGKKCSTLYPECLLSPKLHPVPQTAEDFHIEVKKPKVSVDSPTDRQDSGDVVYVDTSEGAPIGSGLHSRTGNKHDEHSKDDHNDDHHLQHHDHDHDHDHDHVEKHAHKYVQDNVHEHVQDNVHDHVPEKVQEHASDHKTSLQDQMNANLPFERYDNHEEDHHEGILNSDNVSGMDLQDRHNMHKEPQETQEIHTYPPTAITRRIDQVFEPEVSQGNGDGQRTPLMNDDFQKHKNHESKVSYQQVPVNRGLSFIDKPRADHQRQHHRHSYERNQPAILTNEEYSYYMASQAPPRNRPKIQPKLPIPHVPKPKRNKEEKARRQHPKKKFRYSKYHKLPKHHKNHQYEARSKVPERLGLMRGLPAKQVEGHAPVILGWSSENLLPKHSSLVSRHEPVTASFQPEDAVTDEHMHQMLYHYIRDQQSHRSLY